MDKPSGVRETQSENSDGSRMPSLPFSDKKKRETGKDQKVRLALSGERPLKRWAKEHGISIDNNVRGKGKERTAKGVPGMEKQLLSTSSHVHLKCTKS